MQIGAHGELGSINGGNQTRGEGQRAAHIVQSVCERRNKDCDHEVETETLYNRTRRPDWDDIETQE